MRSDLGSLLIIATAGAIVARPIVLEIGRGPPGTGICCGQDADLQIASQIVRPQIQPQRFAQEPRHGLEQLLRSAAAVVQGAGKAFPESGTEESTASRAAAVDR